MLNPHLQPVPLEKAYRLLNHGPTVLVSAQHANEVNVMTAAWACALEFQPAKVTVVLDKSTKTRALIEQSGRFALQVPTTKQINLVHALGSISLYQHPDKLAQCQANLFELNDFPVVADCAAWLLCEVISEPRIQQEHDLFIARVLHAYADDRIFRDGHWYYHEAEDHWRSLHHVAGGHYYQIGAALQSEPSD